MSYTDQILRHNLWVIEIIFMSLMAEVKLIPRACVCVCVCREREKDRRTDVQTDRHTHTQTHRQMEGKSMKNVTIRGQLLVQNHAKPVILLLTHIYFN